MQVLTNLQAAPPGAGLQPHSGAWTFETAAHLLRRCCFGPSRKLIQEAVDRGLKATLELLFQDIPLPPPPINYGNEQDPFVPVGQTWIGAPYSREVNLRFYRQQSFRAWLVETILLEEVSIREKLTLFWHNHFSVHNIQDPTFLYVHQDLLRRFAFGNFRELVKTVTIDPSMLRFLNGNENTFQAPNENYARELFELFTIGKGPLAGPGDYTNFTEEDVRAAARVLTGWRDRGFNTYDDAIEPGSTFRNARHDTGRKQFSQRFDQAVISNMGDQEYAHLVDLIFKKEEVARFISRKLYRWFVYYEIDDAVQSEVIEPMARLLIESDYEIKPALMALLGSEHFFDARNRGPMIRNPLDFILSTIKQLEIPIPANNTRYTIFLQLFQIATLQQMEYYNPPDVAGWKAFYQAPLYYRSWINSVTLPIRMNYTDNLANNGKLIRNLSLNFDPLALIRDIDGALDPNVLIQELNRLLLPQALSEAQIAALKEVLIPGLPDFEWTVEYGDYLDHPDDPKRKDAVSTKLRNLFRTLMSLPEFYLS